MRILVVGSGNGHGGQLAPFVTEQADALRAAGCEVMLYGVTGKGVRGYLGNLPALRKVIADFRPDVVHAHYGLSGLLCCLQRKVPVVVTYHGSDINELSARRLSRLAMLLSAWNIFVSRKTMEIAIHSSHQTPHTTLAAKHSSLIPCGINLPKPANECPNMSAVLQPGKRYVLFAGAFDNPVKDPELAKQVVQYFNAHFPMDPSGETVLVELKGYTRDEVSSLMYGCDALLLTSKSEGSPQVVKEAMACGCPIVSTDVGDVRERIEGIDGCYVANSRDPQELAALLGKALSFSGRTAGCERILAEGLTNGQIAKRLMEVYGKVLSD